MEKRLSNKEFYGLYRKYLPMFKKDHKGVLKLIRQDKSIPKADLDDLLNIIDYDVNEFTVECGRPDTITQEKLQVLEYSLIIYLIKHLLTLDYLLFCFGL